MENRYSRIRRRAAIARARRRRGAKAPPIPMNAVGVDAVHPSVYAPSAAVPPGETARATLHVRPPVLVEPAADPLHPDEAVRLLSRKEKCR